MSKPRLMMICIVYSVWSGCQLPTSTSSNPTQFRGAITMIAGGNWNFHSAPSGCNETFTDGTERASVTCLLDALGGGDASAFIEMNNNDTIVQNNAGSATCFETHSVSDYSAIAGLTLDSTNIAACRPTLDVKTGAWQVVVNPQLSWVGSGSTIADGVILPASAVGNDPAMVFFTAGQTISGTGSPGCHALSGTFNTASGNTIGAPVQVMNALQVPMSFDWYFVPLSCGGNQIPPDMSSSDGGGASTCADVFACFLTCPSTGDVRACTTACIAKGSAKANDFYSALEGCYEHAGCVDGADGGSGPCANPSAQACDSCIMASCSTQLTTCLAN